MKEVKLTKNRSAFVDDDVFDSINCFKWCTLVAPKTNYAMRNSWDKGKKRYFIIYMHRFILNAKKGQIIDHIDGDGLNNQKNNLRFCDSTQNLANKPGHGKLKFKGLKKFRNLYGAYIRKDNKEFYLGLYKTETEAAKAYDQKATELFGEFANLNFPK